MKTNNKIIMPFKNKQINALLSFLFYSSSLFIGYSEESVDHLLILIKICLIGISVLLFLSLCFPDPEREDRIKLSVIAFSIFTYESFLAIAVGKTIINIRYYSAIMNSLLWIFASGFVFFRYRMDFISYIRSILSDKQTKRLVFFSAIAAVIVIILSTEPEGIKFIWDSDTLYDFVYGLNYESLYDAKLLTFHSHVSAAYAHILVLLKLLFNNIRLAFFVLNVLCIICASFGMTFLLRSLIPEKTTLGYLLGSSIFLFSPWVCGMSPYHMYDYYIWCLFPILIFFASKNNRSGFLAVGILISFSKASGIIVFGSVCVGILVWDIFSKWNLCHSLLTVTRTLLKDIKYWYFLSIAAIFIFLFKTGISNETQFEDTRFGFDKGHALHQLKLYFTANFLWISIILAVICIIFILLVNRSEKYTNTRKIVFILLVSDVIFICFNCLCITYRIPRYMNSHIAVVYILSATFLLLMHRNHLSYAFMTLLIMLNTAASFISFDPVSLSLFQTINVGSHNIIDFEKTASPSFEDSIICNREFFSYPVILDRTMTYVMKTHSASDEDNILFSIGDKTNTWGFSGGRYSYTYSDGKRLFDEFYDNSINGLANGYSYEYYNDPEMIPFKVRYIFDEESVENALSQSDSDEFYYIYMPTLNYGKESEIPQKYQILEEQTFSFRGWQMNCIRFRKR